MGLTASLLLAGCGDDTPPVPTNDDWPTPPGGTSSLARAPSGVWVAPALSPQVEQQLKQALPPRQSGVAAPLDDQARLEALLNSPDTTAATGEATQEESETEEEEAAPPPPPLQLTPEKLPQPLTTALLPQQLAQSHRFLLQQLSLPSLAQRTASYWQGPIPQDELLRWLQQATDQPPGAPSQQAPPSLYWQQRGWPVDSKQALSPVSRLQLCQWHYWLAGQPTYGHTTAKHWLSTQPIQGQVPLSQLVLASRWPAEATPAVATAWRLQLFAVLFGQTESETYLNGLKLEASVSRAAAYRWLLYLRQAGY